MFVWKSILIALLMERWKYHIFGHFLFLQTVGKTELDDFHIFIRTVELAGITKIMFVKYGCIHGGNVV